MLGALLITVHRLTRKPCRTLRLLDVAVKHYNYASVLFLRFAACVLYSMLKCARSMRALQHVEERTTAVRSRHTHSILSAFGSIVKLL
jgi:hypothetical protein